MKKLLSAVLFQLLILAAGVLPALADGMLIVDYPPDFPPQRRLVREIPPPSVKFHKVTVEIGEQVSKTAVDQIFVNEFNQELEGTYMFPIPETAAISDFAMFIDGKRQSAELMDKDKARGIYEEIVRKRQDPALLEYMGTNMFKARVYPIPANGEKRIQLEYNEVLKADSGLVKYTYPLNTEKFSSKPLQSVSVMVAVKSKNDIKNVYSPSHKIDVKRVSDREVKVSFEESNVKPDKDFVLYYTVSDKDLGISVISHRQPREDGYFMLLVSPKVEADKSEKIGKNICFVVDTSGSMNGKKIQQVQNALKFCLNNLEMGDHFNIISFSTESRLFEKDMVAAGKDSLEKALKYVDEMRAIGGTNINEALAKALNMNYDKKKPAFIVFLTDGIPTVEVTDVPEILKNVKKENDVNVKIFSLGVGTELNTTLLDKLSAENHGVTEYLAETEDMELKISNFYTKIASPVLTDITVDYGKVRTENIYPKEMPDLFRGSQIVLIGRYRDGGNTAVTLTGKVGEKTQKFTNDASFAEKADENNFLPRIWAQRRIGYLLEEIRQRGENSELKDEIVQLSKKHGIMTPYTSFLVLEDNATISGAPGRDLETRRQEFFETRVRSRMKSGEGRLSASERDALDNANVFMAPASSKAMKEDSGAGAVDMSREVKKIQSGNIAVDFSKVAPEAMRYVEDKTFFNRGGEWQISTFDSSKDEKNVVSVKFGSELFFKLLAAFPKASKYCALGSKVLFEVNGKFVRIADSGEEKADRLDSIIK